MTQYNLVLTQYKKLLMLIFFTIWFCVQKLLYWPVKNHPIHATIVKYNMCRSVYWCMRVQYKSILGHKGKWRVQSTSHARVPQNTFVIASECTNYRERHCCTVDRSVIQILQHRTGISNLYKLWVYTTVGEYFWNIWKLLIWRFRVLAQYDLVLSQYKKLLMLIFFTICFCVQKPLYWTVKSCVIRATILKYHGD